MSGAPGIESSVGSIHRRRGDECTVVVNGHQAIGLHACAKHIARRKRGRVAPAIRRVAPPSWVVAIDADLGRTTAVVTYKDQAVGLRVAAGL